MCNHRFVQLNSWSSKSSTILENPISFLPSFARCLSSYTRYEEIVCTKNFLDDLIWLFVSESKPKENFTNVLSGRIHSPIQLFWTSYTNTFTSYIRYEETVYNKVFLDYLIWLFVSEPKLKENFPNVLNVRVRSPIQLF